MVVVVETAEGVIGAVVAGEDVVGEEAEVVVKCEDML